MKLKNVYETQFCKVEYLKEYNGVFCIWQGFCQGDEYKKPLEFGLKLLEEYSADTWITDTAKGFENTTEDTTWLIEEFIPKVQKTTCERIIFLIDKQSPLQDEIKAQEKILSQYFEVQLLSKLSEYERRWKYEIDDVDFHELSYLYKIAPLGEKKPDDLKTVFSNSRYKCFLYENGMLIAVGRALADGIDASYICDVAVDPEYQGNGLGKAVVNKLLKLSQGHKKIILYAYPGKEPFYTRLGFAKMNTAMAIFENQAQAVECGLVSRADV
ncbi:GNAT family N-acetyltransferase [Sulfurimonas marina]|uniref:GNAT family N-acetyltransferase n=1 Tax=Sulfurimonas marina TaxID=2590551 RepID=A0A7M1AZV9_9BACT|nr:GNAT family N-acetyltransferase [Sulfurimonas marina]QOP42078.1 GNAT family N-acetyltransferase [Sulfurimonas marina]